MDTSSSWRYYTTKLLNRTLPFDTNTAILFVKEQGQESRVPIQDSTEDNSSDVFKDGDGEEIRAFYEQVLKTVGGQEKVDSSTSSKEEKGTTKAKNDSRQEDQDVSMATQKRNPKSKVKKSTSILDLFHFVQEGNLDNLYDALSTCDYDINIRDNYNWTMLMCASCAGHMDIVYFLLENGAQWIDIVDRRGLDAPSIAEMAGHHEIAYVIRTFNSTDNDEAPSTSDCETSKSFHCDTCGLEVTSSVQTPHTVSILHQFSCQHKSDLSAYSLPKSNRGFQMMLRSGWNPDTGLGSKGQGCQYPVKTILKQDRYGLGSKSTRRPRVTHFSAGDVSAVKNRRWRRDDQTDKKKITKKEKKKLLLKERKWEIEMRQYMNSD